MTFFSSARKFLLLLDMHILDQDCLNADHIGNFMTDLMKLCNVPLCNG